MPRYVSAVVAIAATLWLLTQARNVLEPLMIALFIWFLLNAVAATWSRFLRGPDVSPTRLERWLSAVLFLLVLVLLALMVASSADQLRSQLPVYEANLDAMVAKAAATIGLEGSVHIGELVAKIDLSQILVRAAGTAASFISMLIIIIVYIVFIAVEFGMAGKKLDALAGASEKRDEITAMARQINREIETYFGIKIVIGVVQAVPTFVVLSLVGVDAAAFWAVIVFLLSFIPTIGSLVGIVFPSLMALVQFDTFGPFFIVLPTLAAVQLAASNYLEPKLMGKSLNLSALAIFFAIFAGGALWGIVGALIVVPLLAVTVIVFARIPSLRPVAVLLSADGDVGALPVSTGTGSDGSP